MRHYIFSESAKKNLSLLEPHIQKRIIQKLDRFCSTSNPILYAKRLENFEIGQYRFRVGDYRIICDIDEIRKIIIIAIIGHRKEIYE